MNLKPRELVGISRSACRYESQLAAKDTLLTEQMLARAERYPRYGYLMLHGLLKNDGLVVNNIYRCLSYCVGNYVFNLTVSKAISLIPH